MTQPESRKFVIGETVDAPPSKRPRRSDSPETLALLAAEAMENLTMVQDETPIPSEPSPKQHVLESTVTINGTFHTRPDTAHTRIKAHDSTDYCQDPFHHLITSPKDQEAFFHTIETQYKDDPIGMYNFVQSCQQGAVRRRMAGWIHPEELQSMDLTHIGAIANASCPILSASPQEERDDLVKFYVYCDQLIPTKFLVADLRQTCVKAGKLYEDDKVCQYPWSCAEFSLDAVKFHNRLNVLYLKALLKLCPNCTIVIVMSNNVDMHLLRKELPSHISIVEIAHPTRLCSSSDLLDEAIEAMKKTFPEANMDTKKLVAMTANIEHNSLLGESLRVLRRLQLMVEDEFEDGDVGGQSEEGESTAEWMSIDTTGGGTATFSSITTTSSSSSNVSSARKSSILASIEQQLLQIKNKKSRELDTLRAESEIMRALREKLFQLDFIKIESCMKRMEKQGIPMSKLHEEYEDVRDRCTDPDELLEKLDELSYSYLCASGVRSHIDNIMKDAKRRVDSETKAKWERMWSDALLKPSGKEMLEALCELRGHVLQNDTQGRIKSIQNFLTKLMQRHESVTEEDPMEDEHENCLIDDSQLLQLIWQMWKCRMLEADIPFVAEETGLALTAGDLQKRFNQFLDQELPVMRRLSLLKKMQMDISHHKLAVKLLEQVDTPDADSIYGLIWLAWQRHMHEVGIPFTAANVHNAGELLRCLEELLRGVLALELPVMQRLSLLKKVQMDIVRHNLDALKKSVLTAITTLEGDNSTDATVYGLIWRAWERRMIEAGVAITVANVQHAGDLRQRFEEFLSQGMEIQQRFQLLQKLQMDIVHHNLAALKKSLFTAITSLEDDDNTDTSIYGHIWREWERRIHEVTTTNTLNVRNAGDLCNCLEEFYSQDIPIQRRLSVLKKMRMDILHHNLDAVKKSVLTAITTLDEDSTDTSIYGLIWSEWERHMHEVGIATTTVNVQNAGDFCKCLEAFHTQDIPIQLRLSLLKKLRANIWHHNLVALKKSIFTAITNFEEDNSSYASAIERIWKRWCIDIPSLGTTTTSSNAAHHNSAFLKTQLERFIESNSIPISSRIHAVHRMFIAVTKIIEKHISRMSPDNSRMSPDAIPSVYEQWSDTLPEDISLI